MAYIPNECTIEQYNNAVYSEDARHKLYLKIGDTVIEEPDNFCESMTLKNLLLDDGSKNFHLDNFVSKSVELILHDYLLEDLTQEIDIRLGTYINPTIGYVYVPIGLYKVQDNPTTDKNKTTYKLRDRSINFDFGYNAQEIIENSDKTDENGNKYVTKLEIVDDICSKAGIEYVGDRDFAGYDDKIGIYDNSVTGRIYISYIFEQAGRIATINRDGNLTSILINNNLNVQELPFDLIESYTIGESYKISKIIYESGAIYFENGTTDNDTLFINGSNPYIANQEELDRVAELMNGFELDSYSISKIIGNPAIDSFDLIKLQVGDREYKTLAQYSLKYNGKLIQNFETKIEYEARQTNTTKNNESTFKKYVKSEIDNINATLKTTIEETKTQIKGLEESIDLFSVDLTQYTLTIPTDSNKKPLETKNYQIPFYGYYKGKQVTPSVKVTGSNIGITTSTTDKYVEFAVKSDTAINNLTNDFTLTFTYNSSDGVYTLNKVVTIALSIQGKDGEKGVDGSSGNDGKSAYQIWLDAGNTGTEEDYLNSLKGQDGEDGYTPVKGKDYFDGTNGQNGADGKSAYQIWLEQGNTGTEEDYLASLKGEKGDDGYTPQKGVDYFDGANGKDAEQRFFYVKYSANSNGNPMTDTPQSDTEYMGTIDTTATTPPTSYTAYTWVKIKGNTGATGTAGKNGENGLTPYLHIMYSQDGTSFTPEETDESGNVIYALGKKPSAWIGQYTDFVETDSTNFSDYTWYKFTEDIDDTLNDMQNDISQNKTNINNNYQDLVNQIDKKASGEELIVVKNSVETLTTKLSAQIAVTEEIIANGVSKVSTTSGTFDKDGLKIEKSGAETKTKVNQIGVNVKDSSNNDALFAGYVDDAKAEENTKLKKYKGQTVVYTNNTIVDVSLTVGTHSRLEDYEDGTGIFVFG